MHTQADSGGEEAIRSFLSKGAAAPSFSALLRHLAAGSSAAASGVFGSAIAYCISIIRAHLRKPVLLIAKGPREAEGLASDLAALAPCGTYLFPEWETLPGEKAEPHPDIIGDRFLLLARLLPGKYGLHPAAIDAEGEKTEFPPPIIVTSIRSLARNIVLPDAFASEVVRVAPGDCMPMERLLSRLERGGYRRVSMVEDKGEYCVRGGIVDAYPPPAEFPLRVEFSGERVETVRTFHAQSQRSIGEVPAAAITPASELSLLELHAGSVGTLLDYLPRGALVAVHEPAAFMHSLGEPAPPHERALSESETAELFAARQTLRLSLLADNGAPPGDARCALDFHSLEPYRSLALGRELGGEWEKRLFGHIGAWGNEGIEIFIFCASVGERERFIELLDEKGLRLPEGSRCIAANLSEGFIFRDAGVAAITGGDIFARARVLRPRRRFKGTTPLREFTELRHGDYVVHVGHGIGIYRGVTRLAREGVGREFICIEYQDKAKLYVALDQAGLVERYIGVGGAPPALDRLGGGRWQSVRAAAQRAIFDYAAEILSLQAARRSLGGHACGPDTAWQKEFENAFIYEETPDQAAAAEDVRRDMESPRPMDRLICGDVGYGKTEVAMRAAFKMVMEGKQVGVLVPTTVLAQQHLETFSDRFAGYPVRIEMLSRFRSEREQAAVVEGLRGGGVDIVIGTHRLVQPDVRFRDLGLVIIDEEQRFGVRHKERLKQLRMTVDVLTLTATPIPRTLYMSLAGIRDMSTITTPPEDRLAIDTVVREYDEGIIRDAIRRELGRQGQVYLVHNRVETIGRMKETVERLVPEAAVAVGHGQMADEELEEVMQRFVQGKIDVLVCTTIIESGLDIPNANTIIIDNADRFGLADLYQLRGRVGRYKHKAYAYLLYAPGAWLPDYARRRLKAIMEHASLGSGFKISIRDLEIRGAGNILGPEQHGHIAAVGFDLYCKLLSRSIDALRGREGRGIEDIEVRLPFTAELPEGYIPSEEQRIDLYKRLGDITCPADIEEIAAELRDRFGPPPEAALLLLEVQRVKLAARDRGIREAGIQGDKLVAVRKGEEMRPGGRYPRVSRRGPMEMLREMREIIEKL